MSLALLSASFSSCDRARSSAPVATVDVAPTVRAGGAGSSSALRGPSSPTAEAQSAATSPSSVADVGITKKGVASAAYIWSTTRRLRALNVSWVYGWSPWIPAHIAGIESVPMFSVPKDVTPQALQELKREKQAGTVKYLLGFNEPDIKREANMTPLQAATLWPKLEQTGLRLGSPGPGHVWDGWLDRFMALAKARYLRVDFINLHYYVDFTNPAAIDQVRRSILGFHRKYHKPIWVTEIGAMDIRNWGFKMLAPPSTTRAVTFMRRVTAMLDSLPCVKRYAWYTDKSYTTPMSRWTSLYNAHNTMTTLGRAFSRIGT
jgi:hypothetical protein